MTLATVHDHLTAVDQLVVRLERLAAPAYPEDDDRFYGLEPLPLPMFLRGLEAAGPPGSRSFLDVGCGIGAKLALARMLGWNTVAGIERHTPYAEVARRLCPEADVTVTDASSFGRYGEFDLVYMYRPCIDDAAETALEQQIVSRMRTGASAFFPQGTAVDLGEPLAPAIWRVK